jgi:murein DD-endopeptidase MepM/ murein hydrolase activator NlpD
MAAVNRILSRIPWPAIAGSGWRTIVAPISASLRELVGTGGSAAEDSSGNSRGTGPPAADSSGRIAALRRLGDRLARSEGIERLVPVGICLLLVAAAAVSSLPVVASASAAEPPSPAPLFGVAEPSATGVIVAAGTPDAGSLYLGDGSIPNTMQNPGLGTDAASMLLTYTVQQGDTLGKIAGSFGLATSTVYWANKAQLPDPGALRPGQKLLIPPMDGLLVKVGAKDTLDSLAAKYKVSAQDIIDANNLAEAVLVLGQTVIIPGASGGAMPAPKSGSGSSGGGGSYNGGSFRWPVSGYNYISQYFWSGHHALDIAASYGTPVVAAAGGTVVLAGWRSYTGGGNVIWVEESSKLYTTYNHLSARNVRAGQKVSAGQRIGSVGKSGEATGPHLHFEVWLGYPWALGTVADAVNPCLYLAGC